MCLQLHRRNKHPSYTTILFFSNFTTTKHTRETFDRHCTIRYGKCLHKEEVKWSGVYVCVSMSIYVTIGKTHDFHTSRTYTCFLVNTDWTLKYFVRGVWPVWKLNRSQLRDGKEDEGVDKSLPARRGKPTQLKVMAIFSAPSDTFHLCGRDWGASKLFRDASKMMDDDLIFFVSNKSVEEILGELEGCWFLHTMSGNRDVPHFLCRESVWWCSLETIVVLLYVHKEIIPRGR